MSSRRSPWHVHYALACLFALALGCPAHSEAQARLSVSIQGKPDGCLSESSLRKRVLHYLSRTAVPRTTNVRVTHEEGVHEFVLSGAGPSSSRRRFARLPETCADRRDALALAVALAIEHASPGRDETSDRARATRDADHAQDKLETSEPLPAPSDQTTLQRATGQTADAGMASTLDVSNIANDAGASSAKRPFAAMAASSASDPSGGAGSAGREALRTARRAESTQTYAAPSALRQDASERGKQPLLTPALHSGVRLLLQSLPVRALAFSLGGELRFTSFLSAQLNGLVSLRERAEFGHGRVRMQLMAAEALGCGHDDVSALRVLGCLGVSGGALRAFGAGYADDLSTTLGWLAGLARGAVRWSFAPPFAAQLTAGAHLNILRPELRVSGTAQAKASSLAGGSLGVDMIVALR